MVALTNEILVSFYLYFLTGINNFNIASFRLKLGYCLLGTVLLSVLISFLKTGKQVIAKIKLILKRRRVMKGIKYDQPAALGST